MTEEKARMIKQVKVKNIHFAFDRYEDKNIVIPKLKEFKKITGWGRGKVTVYILCGFKERRILPEDLERIYFVKSLNFSPYVMLYDKETLPEGHELRRLQRYVNMPAVFWKLNSFDEYKNMHYKSDF